jgi:hypothetical protein
VYAVTTDYGQVASVSLVSVRPDAMVVPAGLRVLAGSRPARTRPVQRVPGEYCAPRCGPIDWSIQTPLPVVVGRS